MRAAWEIWKGELHKLRNSPYVIGFLVSRRVSSEPTATRHLTSLIKVSLYAQVICLRKSTGAPQHTARLRFSLLRSCRMGLERDAAVDYMLWAKTSRRAGVGARFSSYRRSRSAKRGELQERCFGAGSSRI